MKNLLNWLLGMFSRRGDGHWDTVSTVTDDTGKVIFEGAPDEANAIMWQYAGPGRTLTCNTRLTPRRG